MSIEINNESGLEADEVRILNLATFALDFMNIDPNAELSIVMANETTMEKLHIEFMDEPGPTDVLSFPMVELRPGSDLVPSPEGVLGDIVVCPQVAAKQAETAGHPMINEILLLVTHGMLHLVGFDHAEPEEEKEMFGLQKELLEKFYESESSNA